jgi:hypothetical protein
MKKLFIVSLLMIAMQPVTYGQITKANVDKMMKELGTSQDKIESLYVGNRPAFYTDGSYKKTYDKFKKKNQEYENSVFIEENGILLKTKKDGKLNSMRFYPFAKITNIYVSATSIDIYLND